LGSGRERFNMAKYSIRPIPICKAPFDKGLMTYRLNYGRMVDLCAYIWYIEGAESKILVDAGVRADMYLAHGYSKAENIQTMEEGLGKLKLRPEDIDIVILTHLHWDHVAFASKFTKARFIIQKAELDFARHPHPANAAPYDEELFKDLNFEVVEGDKEIIEGVKVLFTPGHTPGGQSVAVKTSKGMAIIPGFCCISDNFEVPPELKAKGLQIVPPGLHVNLFQAYDSTLRVKQAADIIVPPHDMRFIGRDRIP